MACHYSFLAWLPWFEIAGAAGEDGDPDGGIGWLLTGTEKEDAVWGEESVNAGEQGLAGLLGEVEHDVAQEDDVKAIASAVEGQLGRAKVGLAEVAELANLGLDGPVFAGMVEIADDKAGGEPAVDFDAMVKAELGAFDDIGGEVGAFDARFQPTSMGKCSCINMARL